MNPDAIEAAAKAKWARHGPSMPRMTWETEYADYKNHLRADAEAALEAAAPYLIRDARAAELEAAADGFAAKLPDGTGNGRAYNSYRVADTLRARAAAIRAGEA